MAFSKNTIFYLAIAIAIIAVVYIATFGTMHAKTYSVKTALYSSNLSQLYTFNTTKFLLAVNNTGNTYVSGMLVGFYVDGVSLHTYNVSIPVGKTAYIYINYTFAAPGQYSFKAISDPAKILNLLPGSTTTAVLTANVSNTTAPEPFSSIPNTNISSSHSFQLLGNTFPFLSLLYGDYNISVLDSIYAPSGNIAAGIGKNTYGAINISYGVYAKYANGSYAQSLWLQGASSTFYIAQIASSFISIKNVSESHNGTWEFLLENNTSLCIGFSGGWTKILTYHSRSGNYSCVGISESVHNQSEVPRIRALTQNAPLLFNYSSKLEYVNSTYLGSSLGISGSTLSVTKMYQNKHGMFIGYIKESARTPSANNSTGECYGLLSNGKICSVFVLPKSTPTTSANVLLVETTEVVGNHTARLYSLVNATSEADANYNAVHLLEAINMSGLPMTWNSPFSSKCVLNSTALSCNFLKFYSQNSTAVLHITNLANRSVELTQGACYMSGMRQNETENVTLVPHGAANLTVKCRIIPLPMIGMMNSYTLELNYTVGSASNWAYGTLNVSNMIQMP